MKRALIVIAVILIVAFVGIGIFIATFNIATYKGFIVSQLERMTGNKVEIGGLSMKVQKDGALLDVEDFKIYTESTGNRAVLLSFERLEALVELAPLLARILRVARMSVSKPEIRISKGEGGALRLAGYGKPDGTSTAPVGPTPAGSAPSAAKAFDIYINSIEIKEGTLRFQDMSFSGTLKIKVRELELSKGKISKLSAEASLADGRVSMPLLKVPVEKINLTATAESDSIMVTSFSASVATSTLSGSGKFDDIFGGLRATLQATAEVQGIKEFIFSILGQKQSMDGNARLTFDGTMTGSSWPEISKTLTGGGEFYLDRGMMMNTNILNQTLGSLTLFPGLPDMVKGYVPAPIQQAFGNDNTVIEPLRQVYVIEGGYVMISDLNFKTDTFEMRGEAKSSFTGDVSGSGIIRFAQSVSAAMLKAAPEMKYITDSQGIVEFPMAFKIGENGFKVIPDLKYVGKKVAVQKAGEIVNDFIQKAVNGHAQPGSAGNSPGEPVKAPKLKDLVKSFMEEQRMSSQ